MTNLAKAIKDLNTKLQRQQEAVSSTQAVIEALEKLAAAGTGSTTPGNKR